MLTPARDEDDPDNSAARGPSTGATGKFVLSEDDTGFHWVLISPNGRSVARSFEPYATLKAAVKGIGAIRRLAPDAVVVHPGDPRRPPTAPRTVRGSAGTCALRQPEPVVVVGRLPEQRCGPGAPEAAVPAPMESSTVPGRDVACGLVPADSPAAPCRDSSCR